MTQTLKPNSFLKLVPTFRDYVWGGDRLRPGHNPTAEAWVVWEDDRIESGPLAGKTLGEGRDRIPVGTYWVQRVTPEPVSPC